MDVIATELALILKGADRFVGIVIFSIEIQTEQELLIWLKIQSDGKPVPQLLSGSSSFSSGRPSQLISTEAKPWVAK